MTPHADNNHKPKPIRREGVMLALSSPSGAGKSSISRGVLQQHPGLHLSVSYTSRPPRENERDGTDYHFVTSDEFALMISKGQFLEYAYVFGNYYGTPAEQVMEKTHMGQDVLFDIDWQGVRLLKEKLHNLVSVFILPPSHQALESRLKNRGLDSADEVAKRMAKATDEISHYNEYDYIVINDDLTWACTQVGRILQTEALRLTRQNGIEDFICSLKENH